MTELTPQELERIISLYLEQNEGSVSIEMTTDT